MPLRDSKLASVADSADVSKIQPSDLRIMAAPVTPQENDIWAVWSDGPPLTFTIYAHKNGVTRPVLGPVAF